MCTAPFTLEDAKAIYDGAKAMMPKAIVDVSLHVKGVVRVHVDRITRVYEIR